MTETNTITQTNRTTPIPIKPNTEEEFENYVASTLGKYYVRLDESGKPDKNFKDFVYSVAEPNGVYKEMYGFGNKKEFIIKIRLLKRDKNTLVPKSINGVTIKEFAFVPKHRWDGNEWEINDEDGEHVVVTADFEKKFKPE